MTAFQHSYADFGWRRSLHQIKHALNDRPDAAEHMQALLESVELAEQRMVDVYGGPIKDGHILELGPGQGFERAYYFGRQNKITTIDLDVIPQGFEPLNYLKMVQTNGFGRFAKTIGRELIVGRPNRKAWMELIGVQNPETPERTYGNICEAPLPTSAYDMMMSWSVFEHVPDPRAALENVIQSLKPGGMFYISLHLYTSNNGHHDIRAFTGNVDALPMWAHLRESQEGTISPSSYLNEWRIQQWRDLFEELTPGYTEIMEQFEHPEVYGPRLKGSLREELSEYSDDELLTVNLVYAWKKPE